MGSNGLPGEFPDFVERGEIEDRQFSLIARGANGFPLGIDILEGRRAIERIAFTGTVDLPV